MVSLKQNHCPFQSFLILKIMQVVTNDFDIAASVSLVDGSVMKMNAQELVQLLAISITRHLME